MKDDAGKAFEVRRDRRITGYVRRVQIAGESSEVQVEIGALERSSSVFAFPGVDGVFERLPVCGPAITGGATAGGG